MRSGRSEICGFFRRAKYTVGGFYSFTTKGQVGRVQVGSGCTIHRKVQVSRAGKETGLATLPRAPSTRFPWSPLPELSLLLTLPHMKDVRSDVEELDPSNCEVVKKKTL